MHASGASGFGPAPNGLGAIVRLGLTLAGFTCAGWMAAGPVVEWTRLQPFPATAQARTLMHDGQAVVALCDGGVILHHAPAGSWQRAATPTTNDLRSGLFAMDRFIVAGDGGAILTSDDGLGWEMRNTSTGANLVAVVAAGSNILALGAGGALLRSTDGLAWSSQPTPTFQTLRAAASGAGTYVAVGDAGTVLNSSDGTDWTLRTSVTEDNLEDVVFGNGVFMARGPHGVVISTDGLEWSSAAMAPAGRFTRVRSVGSQFIAVGSAGALATSPDGSIWTRRENATTSDLVDLATDGSQVVVVGAAGTLLRSTDGAVWDSLAPVTTENLSAVAWGNDRWLVLAQALSGPILRSNDGLSWSVTLQDPNSGIFLAPLRFEGGTFCAVFREPAALCHLVLRSVDGIDWGWEPGDTYGNEIGLADFVAQSHMTVTVWVPGWSLPPWNDWIQPAISVTSWSDLGTDAEHRLFWFDDELRSIAYGQNRFITVGKRGAMFVSNTIGPAAPVLAIGVDQASRRLRLEITGPSERTMRLEFSSDLANWTCVGTYGSADWPLWFDLPSEPGGATGFYRAVMEPEQWSLDC
ncbi:MAG TPA: hypothetical protein PKM43_03305 [Verrucomicrobiota bacterium]|nr:hypothetical protein [Verrucomicrobiota bacterium]